MRQRVGEKKVRKYRAATGLPVCSALVRGGSHIVSLLLEEGKVVRYDPRTGEIEADGLTWDYEGWLKRAEV